MTASPTKKSYLIDDLEDQVEQLKQSDPAPWISDIRSNSLSLLKTLEFPTKKDEEWKYTNISPILKNHYRIATNAQISDLNYFEKYCGKDETRFVFVNGHFSKELSCVNLPQGVELLELNDAVLKGEDQIKKFYDQSDPVTDSAFSTYHQALTNNGTWIRLKKNTVVESLIHIVHITSAAEQNLMILPRTLIHCEQSSEATVLESHISTNDDSVYLTNALTDICLDDNAVLHYIKAQKESLKAFHVGTTRVLQERNSNFDGFTLTVGAAITRNELDIALNGEGANTTLNGLYSLFGKQLADNHTSVDHMKPNSTSNQLYKGILNEKSHAVFNGKVFVRSIAQQTNSYQLNKNLLLGEDCHVDTKPQLEIFADDVKCTHGATVGQLNEAELFYLQARGVSKVDAVQMLSRGFVDDLLNTINNQEINRKLHLLLEPSFAHLK